MFVGFASMQVLLDSVGLDLRHLEDEGQSVQSIDPGHLGEDVRILANELKEKGLWFRHAFVRLVPLPA